MAMETPTVTSSSGQMPAGDGAWPRAPGNVIRADSPTALPTGQAATADLQGGFSGSPPPMQIGRVEAVTGTPAAVGVDGKGHALRPGDAVHLGETLQAGPGGRLSVGLSNGETLHLGADGRVLLQGVPTAAVADATTPQIYLQTGEMVVLPSILSTDVAGIGLQGFSGEIHGRASLIARVSPGAGLEVTLLPGMDAAGGELDVTADGQSQHLQAPFDHLTLASGNLDASRLEHLACNDPRLDFAAELGATGGRCRPDEASAAEDLETSPGGDMAADSGTFTVTQPTAAFDLKPQEAPLADPSGVDLVGAPVRLSLRSHINDLLLQGTQDFTASSSTSSTVLNGGTDFSLMRLWDPGHIWRGLGSHAELAPAVPEVPLESGRLITSRAGEMAQIVATGAITSEIETFLSVPSGRLHQVMPDVNFAGGGAMRLEGSIHLEAGQSIWFDTFFDAADPAPNSEDSSAFRDFAVLTVATQAQTMVIPIADESPQVAGFGATGWQSIKYTAGVTGDYSFGFAVLDDGGVSPSVLYVDNVRSQDASGFSYAELAARRDNLGGTVRILVPQPIANDDVVTVSAGGQTAINVATQLLANDVDPDTFDGMRIVGVDSASTHGHVSFASGRTIDYDPKGYFASLAEGEIGVDSFKYILDGGNGEQATATVRVNVVGVNDAPTAAPTFVASSEARENGVAISIANILATATDVDSDFTPTSLRVVNATAASGATVHLEGPAGRTSSMIPRAPAPSNILLRGRRPRTSSPTPSPTSTVQPPPAR